MAFGFALVLALILATAPAAQAKAVFSVQPTTESKVGYFILSAKPGTKVHGSVRVLNIGDETGSASVYAVDGTTGQTSGAVYRSRQEPRKDVGSWIHLSKTKIRLAPRTKESIPFTVTVPAGAFRGQHLGGIVLQPSTLTGRKTVKKTKKSSFQVKIRELSVVAVQVNLPGRRVNRMAINGLRASGIPGRQSLEIGFSNRGNVFVKCRGSLKVANSSGQQVKRRRFRLDTFVSRTHIHYPVYTAGKPLRHGSYKGTVAITCRGRHLVRSFPFKVTSANQKQVFGAPAAQSEASSSSSHTLLYILLGTAVLLLAAIAFGFFRYLRGEGYI